jgi:hypothetical protein
MTIKPPPKQINQIKQGGPAAANRKSLRPLREESNGKNERPISKIGASASSPKYLALPTSRIINTSPIEDASVTIASKGQPFDPAKAESTIAEDEAESENLNNTIHRMHQFNTPFKNYNVLLVPLNAMFDMRAIEMTVSHRFGRNNTTNHPAFKGFGTLVVSRNHVDMIEKDGKVYM